MIVKFKNLDYFIKYPITEFVIVIYFNKESRIIIYDLYVFH